MIEVIKRRKATKGAQGITKAARGKDFFLFLALLALALAFCPVSFSAWAAKEMWPEELTPGEIRQGRYYSIIDEEGKLLAVTGRRLFAGDEYLTADNRLFEIYRVENYTASARYRRTIKLAMPSEYVALWGSSPRQEERGPIAIFHTHNAESYVPTDGTESVYGRGGVHDVGDAFKKALEEKGIKAIHSEDMHLPHDRGAYLRARETVLRLLEKQPEAIFDLHRDAAPPEQYLEKIDSDLLAQIQFVVGRQNPNMEINRQFAYDLKGYADRFYANLVRGVLLNNGNYNQDLYPTMLLLEVGSHLTARELAEESIVLFSDVVAYYFYGPGILEAGKEHQTNTALWSTAKILAIAGSLFLFFFFLNNPGRYSALQRKLGNTLYRAPQAISRRAEELSKSAKFFLRLAQSKLAEFRGKNRMRR